MGVTVWGSVSGELNVHAQQATRHSIPTTLAFISISSFPLTFPLGAPNWSCVLRLSRGYVMNASTPPAVAPAMSDAAGFSLSLPFAGAIVVEREW